LVDHHLALLEVAEVRMAEIAADRERISEELGALAVGATGAEPEAPRRADIGKARAQALYQRWRKLQFIVWRAHLPTGIQSVLSRVDQSSDEPHTRQKLRFK
jgi:hypothetical protein